MANFFGGSSVSLDGGDGEVMMESFGCVSCERMEWKMTPFQQCFQRNSLPRLTSISPFSSRRASHFFQMHFALTKSSQSASQSRPRLRLSTDHFLTRSQRSRCFVGGGGNHEVFPLPTTRGSMGSPSKRIVLRAELLLGEAGLAAPTFIILGWSSYLSFHCT